MDAMEESGDPYVWSDEEVPPEASKLWKEVAVGIDKSQTVVWKNAVESLDAANKYLAKNSEARVFTEMYMKQIIGILVEQQPSKIGPHERSCVEDSLDFSVAIIAQDLEIQLSRKGESKLLVVLSTIFNKKKTYYKGAKSWNVNNVSGLPEVRLRMIESFRTKGGFNSLAQYLKSTEPTSLDLLHMILSAIGDAINTNRNVADDDDFLLVAQAVMQYMANFTEDELRKLPTEMLSTVRLDLQKIFDKLISVRRKDSLDFYQFWRDLVFKLISSQSLPLRLFGWEQVKDLIDASHDHRPPPNAFVVREAGCTFVNGVYTFGGVMTPDGYSQRGVEISYERKIPPDDPDGAGKHLTLFRCTMRSQQKWWFLSEADEEQPGTDRDIDYYQHKSKDHEETEPPASGWITCRNTGVDPPPKLRGVGLTVPAGQEYNTLEHLLAKWTIENKIVELVLGASLHREVVHRSIPLIEFLALMCNRDEQPTKTPEAPGPNAFCLTISHLLLAWKTCTSKADAAVSDEIYHLLVSILPSLPNHLAIPLLQAIQASLADSKQNFISEVAEFCCCLASHNDIVSAKGEPNLTPEVRAVVLDLLWAVLTHTSDASSTSTHRSYDVLKRYVTAELRVDPLGRKHREKFLQSCTSALATNAQVPEVVHSSNSRLDETLALRMVKLTQFVLEACPRNQAEVIVCANKGALASLIFSELTSFLSRSKDEAGMSPGQKKSQNSSSPEAALSERLRILRFAYGISENVNLSNIQLEHLWRLCSIPADKEELMVFIASASTFSGSGPRAGQLENAQQVAPQPAPQQPQTPTAPDDGLTAAFSDEVRIASFVDLMCSEKVDWGLLGERAYHSFNIMYKRLRQSPGASSSPALNALWRICLSTGNEAVAMLSMKDLLAVYAAMVSVNKTTQGAWSTGPPGAGGNAADGEAMQMDDAENDFGKRVFDCLVQVKQGLDAGDLSSERSAERCLRILNATVGHDGLNGRSVASSAVVSINGLAAEATLGDIFGILPHGMCGQSAYRRVSIMANKKATIQGPMQSPNDPSSPSPRASSNHRFNIDVHPLETLGSVRMKVAHHCHCRASNVKAITVNGRNAGTRSGAGEGPTLSLNLIPEDSTVDQLGIVTGCEMVFVVADRQAQVAPPNQQKPQLQKASAFDLNEIFGDRRAGFADKMFQTLLAVLEALPPRPQGANSPSGSDTARLVWDLFLAMPTNSGIVEKVRSSSGVSYSKSNDEAAMNDVSTEQWSTLLNKRNYQRSVYVLQTIDAFLQPAPEILATLPNHRVVELESTMKGDAIAFRRGFIESGGFNAVVNFFAASRLDEKQSQQRMGDAAALRILKCCMFGNSRFVQPRDHSAPLDDMGTKLLDSLSSAEGLLRSLTSMVVKDDGISTSTISDVMKFLRLLFLSQNTTETFISLPDRLAEKFLITLLLWEGGPEATRTASSVATSSRVRENMRELILNTPLLSRHVLPWLIGALGIVDVGSDATAEYFDVLKKLVGTDNESDRGMKASQKELQSLGTAVCKKLASCPRPTNDVASIDATTGVLCGCLRLLRALIESGGGDALAVGTDILLKDLNVNRWSTMAEDSSSTLFSMSSSRPKKPDRVLIDLMGAIFDGFLAPGGSSSVVSICCDKDSCRLGFEAVAAAARSCSGSYGYLALVKRINGIVTSAAPFLRHRWGQVAGGDDSHSRSSFRNPSKYSGLRNQGCTCYMNSFLQQLFMMNDLRKEMCAAPLPESLRSSGGAASKGSELIGKTLSLQWDSGVSYEAIVENYDETNGMHTVRYCPLPLTAVGGQALVSNEDFAKIPVELPEEFILSEGRPGKETGVFEIVTSKQGSNERSGETMDMKIDDEEVIKESDDESKARHLFEEVQRTFIHLDEGSRGRCYDPRAFVEACACLKLEFDVWQQNDASEFAMKLLDRMEIALKRWAPDQFRYLEHKFGLKQTKQKICKECNLKTNREENLMSIDCQIRGKSDIHDALETMCEVEYMEGNNKVFCDRCKKNTDTVLRTAISALPDVLVLSLKRFDLDFNTFETVKLNSRCAFGQTLNMKAYTLEGVEAMENGKSNDDGNGPSPMDTSDDGDGQPQDNPLSAFPDDDYEYKLAGVLVHAGVAQGGHYYSFIKDRSATNDGEAKWYKFDDEDVTLFDPSLIEHECFGGKVKKENKWPNGTVNTVETEQFANALMLFYEKVKPTELPDEKKQEEKKKKDEETEEEIKAAEQRVIDLKVAKTTGYNAFQPDVRRSNATHRWQTFLFDSEFQKFLKGLLGLCRFSRSQNQNRMEMPASAGEANSWQEAIIDMSLSFCLDVLLYAADKSSLHEWVTMLSETFVIDTASAKRFVYDLAERSGTVSANWLRTFLAECPDHESRKAAARIFASAIRSCASTYNEKARLAAWTGAWREQMLTFKPNLGTLPVPTNLERSLSGHEDVRTIGTEHTSSIGIIISHINVLLEAAPRARRYNSELCQLIRDIAIAESSAGGDCLRAALNESHVTSRIISLIVRDKAPGYLRVSFPGSSMPYELAETQARQETNPTTHLLPIGASQMMTNDMNSRGASSGSPSAADFLTSFEALGVIIGMKGMVLAALVETKEQPRGRPSIVLTEQAANALSTIFQESCYSGSGMSQHDIEDYLQRSGLDASSVPPQKIVDILTKYPSVNGNGSRPGSFLSLEGFLAYYRDTAQTNEVRVRSDLHTFGYRPDLSRRDESSRIEMMNDDVDEWPTLRASVESVALDVSSSVMQTNGTESIKELSMLGLDIFQLHGFAYGASEPLAEYFLASTSFERDTRNLIVNTQRSIFRAPAAWAGNEVWAAATMIFRVLVCIQDSYQQDRIRSIMQSSAGSGGNDQKLGLLDAAGELAGPRATHVHANDNHSQYSYERYVELIKELFKLKPVAIWMGEHRQLWSWMERDLIATDDGNPQQIRGEHSGRRDGAAIVENPRSSDTDMQGMQDSEDDDDDDDAPMYEDRFRDENKIRVSGAGLEAINGVYVREGTFENAGKYVLMSKWKGADEEKFSLFRCAVSNNTKHWYISIVPPGVLPGTNTDIDFYSAPVTEHSPEYPPATGWTKANEGLPPCPVVEVIREGDDLDSGRGVI